MSAPEANSPLPAGPRRSIRRWFQFRLRTLLAAVTVVAAALLAFRVYVEPYARQRQALKVIERLGGRVVTTEAGPWQRRLLGADLQNITLIDLADCHQIDEYLPHVASLPCLETLVVGGEEFTDDHLRRLRLPKLTGLVLDSTAVTDDSLAAWRREHSDVAAYQSDRQAIRASPWDVGVHVGLPDYNDEYPQLADLVGADYFTEVPELTVTSADGRAALALLGRLRHLKELYLRGGWVNDADVERLRGVNQLTSLTLFGSDLTNNGLAPVASLARLERLSVIVPKVSDAGLRHIAQLTELKQLSLRLTRVSDGGLVFLRGLTKLEALDLGDTHVTDAGLEYVAPLTRLKKLGLAGVRILGNGLAHLKGLTELTEVNLHGTLITDARLIHIVSCPHVKELTLSGTSITDAGLWHLHRLEHLERVHLSETKVSRSGVSRLRLSRPGLYVGD